MAAASNIRSAFNVDSMMDVRRLFSPLVTSKALLQVIREYFIPFMPPNVYEMQEQSSGPRTMLKASSCASSSIAANDQQNNMIIIGARAGHACRRESH